jgi:hypothetical protein
VRDLVCAGLDVMWSAGGAAAAGALAPSTAISLAHAWAPLAIAPIPQGLSSNAAGQGSPAGGYIASPPLASMRPYGTPVPGGVLIGADISIQLKVGLCAPLTCCGCA